MVSQPWILERRLKLANLQRRAGDPAAALVILDQAEEIFGPGLTVDLMRASVLLDLGRNDEAAAVISQAKSRARRPIAEIRQLELRLQEASTP